MVTYVVSFIAFICLSFLPKIRPRVDLTPFFLAAAAAWAADGLSDDVPTIRCWYGLWIPRCNESWLLAAEDIGEGVECELSSMAVLDKNN